jgi:hypothetical protein
MMASSLSGDSSRQDISSTVSVQYLRIGTLTDASWHYKLMPQASAVSTTKTRDTCLLAETAGHQRRPVLDVVSTIRTPSPTPANPPQKLKDFFKGILKDIKEQFTLKYYMDGLDPASIQEYPLSVIEATIWTYTTTTNTPSSQYATKSECLSARDINPNANKSIDCKYTFATSTSGSGVWTLWYQQTGMKNSVSRGTFPNKAACEAERTAKFPAQKGTKTECRTVPQSCTSTVPGQSKHWYVLIPDYDPELPYIYDIVDANYRKFDFNWSTFTVQEMAYRYWGPQFVSQLDTQNVFATLMNRLNVSTDELAQRTGLPKRAEPYQSFYNRQDQTFSALFSIQTQADVRVFGSLDNLKNNTFSLPLQLNYSVYDPATGVSKVYPATPTLVSSRPTVQVDQAGNPIPENQINTTTANIRNEYSTVYLYFDGVAGVTAEDRFQLVDTQRQEILVEGAVGEVDSYAESNSLSRFVDWWVYVYKPTPTTEKRSNLYPTQTDCQNAARKQFPSLDPGVFQNSRR